MIQVSNGIKTSYVHAIEQSSMVALAIMHLYAWYIHPSQMLMPSLVMLPNFTTK